MTTLRTTVAWSRGLRWAAVAAVVAVLCYLAWKPSPSAETIPLLRRDVARWFDHHDFLCNASAWALCAVVVHAGFSGRRRERLTVLAWRAAAMGGMVVALECVQRFLPRRSFDPDDIGAGLLGLAVASLPWLRWSRPAATPGADKPEGGG